MIEPVRGRARAPRTTGSALIELFRGRPLIVLSPHFDDACFSLGGFLKARGEPGLLINLFTKGSYVVRPELAKAALPPDGIHFIRDSEDREFARACGLERHELGCEEPSLRGRRPSEMAGVEDDIGQVEDRLLTLLPALAKEHPEPSALFVPLGIGRHVNHRATAEAVMRNLKRLLPLLDLYFYEDLPYASNVFNRMAALERLRRRVGNVQRHVFVAPWHEKRDLIGIYQSQLRASPSVMRFRPAAFPLAAHEAFWSLTQKNIMGDTPCSGIGPASS